MHASVRPLHSCRRRAVDMAEVARARGWKIMGRAIRGVMLKVGGPCEVRDVRRVADALQVMVEELDEPLPMQAAALPGRVRCLCCSQQMAATVHAACLDIDQAFELCSAARVGQKQTVFEL